MSSILDIDNKPVSALRCLGPVSVRLLAEAGIDTVGDLKELGAAEAYLRASFANPEKISLNLLYALHAGLMDLRWPAITLEMRDMWKQELENKYGPMVNRHMFEEVNKSDLPEGTKVVDSTWEYRKRSTGTLRGQLNVRGFK